MGELDERKALTDGEVHFGYEAAGDGKNVCVDMEFGDWKTPNKVSSTARWPQTTFMAVLSVMWGAYKPEEEIEEASTPVKDFYREQNTLVEDYVSNVSGHCQLSPEEQDFLDHCVQSFSGDRSDAGDDEDFVRNAVYLSNLCNVILLCAQAFAFLSTKSLSLLATMTDAVLDFVSGIMIFLTWKFKNARNKYAYPVGQSRLEPLGVIGMACLMTSATLVTMQESVTALLGGKDAVKFTGLTVPVISIIAFALVTKLSLYILCRRSNNMSVKGFAVDHLNDVIANSISVTTVYLAQRYLWLLDPVGGIVISLLIINNWVRHTLEHVQNLLGRVADPKTLSVVTFVAWHHHPKISKVDTVRAYHVGNNVFVECDIVLPSDMSLFEAHEIGESLQHRIETIENVDRAFVHLDTEADHSPDTEHKII